MRIYTRKSENVRDVCILGENSTRLHARLLSEVISQDW